MAGDLPLWYGEWSLATQFNATDDFLYKWADAQKLAYSQTAGWLVRPYLFFGGRSRKGLVFIQLVLEFQDRINEHIRATVVRPIPVRFDRDEAQ
jgi:hypothetical protein